MPNQAKAEQRLRQSESKILIAQTGGVETRVTCEREQTYDPIERPDFSC